MHFGINKNITCRSLTHTQTNVLSDLPRITLQGKKYWDVYTLHLQELIGHRHHEAPGTVFVLVLMPEEVWDSAVSVVFKRFQFAITPLKILVDHEISSIEQISSNYLLQLWHLIEVSLLNQ